MSTQNDTKAAEYGFPVVRRGYERSAVDAFARSAHAEISDLRRQYEVLAGHYAQLQAAHDQQQSAQQRPASAEETDFSGLGGRAQEILRLAEEQARDLTGRASVDADRLAEQTEHEVQMLRDHAVAELAETRSTELARLEGLRGQTEREVATVLAASAAEADQLLQAARFEATAIATEALGNARSGVEAAQLQAATVLADAERDALAVQRDAAAQRDQVLSLLTAESEDLRSRIEQALAESTQMHRRSAEHLAAQADEAGRLRAETMAEVERIRGEAVAEAEGLLAHSRQQAATLEERSRQEFAWRRRQLRQEQELLTRRKQAMLSQLASLSALAVETAESMPEVPDLGLGDQADADQGEQGPTEEGAAEAEQETAVLQAVTDEAPAGDEGVDGTPGEQDAAPEAEAEGQNNRSATSSIPRSAS